MAIRTLLQGIGLGAGLMYLWDPEFGRRRRARILDQWEHAKHCTEDFLDKAQRDLSNRASGVTAEARSMLHRDTADDRVITARVRSKLGRYCSHPRAIAVESESGHVALSGQVLAEEAGDLLKAVCCVPGVKHVENRLEVYRQSDNIAALQGESRPPVGEPYGFLQQNWSPATRALGQLGGLTLIGNCLAHRSLSSTLLGAVGVGLFLRASTNRSLGQLMGTQVCPQAIRIQHDLHDVSSESRLGESRQDTAIGSGKATPSGQASPRESDQLGPVGQPAWVEGQPAASQSVPTSQMPGEISPAQIPPVHVQTQPSPNQPERGRLG